MRRKMFSIFTATALLVISVMACIRVDDPTLTTPISMATPTATATPTPTPIPTPTPAPEVNLGPMSDFTVRLNGLSVEGSFKMGEVPMTFAYRPNEVAAEEAGLRVNGAFTYDFADHANGSLALGALLRPVGDTCEKIGLTTDPLTLPQFNLTIPSQAFELDLTLLSGTSASVPAEMLCRATRLITEETNSPLTNFLINQINQFLN